MWLLEAKSQRLVHFMDDRVVLCKYAVLSHTWQDEEVTFQDMQHAPALARQKHGYEKIDKVCQQAIADSLPFAWVDTCCINKESSAELSEAINSMFRWYSNAAVCYAYLTDVDIGGVNLSSTAAKATQFRALLKNSRWLTRGWTLQELIAPERTVFYDKNWHAIGDSTISNLQVAIADLTGIDTALLRDRRLLQGLPIGKRLSWAAERRTTREEDEAYSLLGILELNMPLLYGEGPRALLRLQEDVLNTTTDQSILHWTPTHPSHVGLLMAPEVNCFKHCGELLHRPDVFEDESHEVVSNGLRISLPMRNLPNESGVHVAALNCKTFTRQYDQAVLELRNIRPMHLAQTATRTDIYEVVRDQISPRFQPQSDWHNSDGSWKDDVILVKAIILKHSVSSVLRFDDNGQTDVVSAYPPHCWDHRRKQFFVLGNRSSRKDLVPSGYLHLRSKHVSTDFYLSFSQSRFGSKYSIELTDRLDEADAPKLRPKMTSSNVRLVLGNSKSAILASVLEADGRKQEHNTADISASKNTKILRVRIDTQL
ncbi:Putative heterokaryon incompatibility [Septoria linicola]|uniref:Heterokaryon incompatibility n=1 Tax=Septoria linicola TaxID=215465 RepID=A0A9Q9EIV2_9PEZI|nr:putative heterokaryon incompatibility [Septoria linicola]USW53161.1 Putative heterokaryon incompatibility [Septoria linicola]